MLQRLPYSLINWMKRELACMLQGGHSFNHKLEGKRYFLRCFNCGKETPGWILETRPVFKKEHSKGKVVELYPKNRKAG